MFGMRLVDQMMRDMERMMQSPIFPYEGTDPWQDLERSMNRQMDAGRQKQPMLQQKQAPHIKEDPEKKREDMLRHQEALKALHPENQDEATRLAWEEHHRLMDRSRLELPKEEQEQMQAVKDYHSALDDVLRTLEPRKRDLIESYSRAPRVHILPHKNDYTVVVDLPGVRKEDVRLTYAEDEGMPRLIVSGERKASEQDEEGGWHVHRSVYGSFSRSFRLPPNVEHAVDKYTAKFENGVMRITIPKGPEEKRSRAAHKITIQ